MIDAKELRIGNILNGENGPVIVCALNDNGRVAVKYLDHVPLFAQEAKEISIKPILLTENILLKCGFETHYLGIKTYYHPLLELDHEFKLMGVDHSIKVIYLHQLQNIFFALTGEELKIKYDFWE